MSIEHRICQFRLASRELFNQYFSVAIPKNANSDIAEEQSEDGWILHERFAEVEELLFQKLVSEPSSIKIERYRSVPQSQILVTLRFDKSPIKLNREQKSGYWDFPLKEISREATLLFVSYFDWDTLRCFDNRFVQVQIKDWSSHPETNGKYGLIESHLVSYRLLSGEDSE
jgi:hypothetical protein